MQIDDNTKELVTSIQTAGQRVSDEGLKCSCDEVLIHEHFMEVSVNGYVVTRLSCTADHLKELVIGRLYTEGIIAGTGDIVRLFICAKGNVAEVTLKEDITFKPYGGNEPTCCAGNRQFLAGEGSRKMSRLPEADIDQTAVFALAQHFKKDSGLHRITSGTHSCYLYMREGEIAGFEDISRHNALDKAVGHMLLTGAVPAGCMLYTTGRVPADMVQKTVMAGIPVLVSKSVPTDAAVEMAGEYGLQLICKAWPDSFTQMTGALTAYTAVAD